MPGPAFGPYPERPSAPRRGWLAGLQPLLQATTPAAGQRAFAHRVRALQAGLATPGSEAFESSLAASRALLGARGLSSPVVEPVLAHVLQATQQALGLALYDSQIGAAGLLLDRQLAEMATGEGKTLAAMAAAATAALAGVPVHVVTANAYLAARDAQEQAPLYRLLGLRVAAIGAEQSDAQRREAWAADVVYTTASELIFDYLRDRLRAAGEAPRLRGLCMAIVDEADSVLIDEARTPFVLAAPDADPQRLRCQDAALQLARRLAVGRDCTLDALTQQARLTESGRQACRAAADLCDAPLWRHEPHRAELVQTALAALHLYRRDVHYLVSERGVEIIDPATGRVASGRRWQAGLHAFIERIVGLDAAPEQRTLAQLSFQSFFPRYWRLSGTSGTLLSARAELRQVYGLRTQAVPLRRPCLRRHEGLRLFLQGARRWDQLTQALALQHAAGVPVLVACETLADADALSSRLAVQGLSHQRLDARQDADEARRVAAAGQRGAITVSTRIAGRGTDIRLGDGVAALGGLYVIDAQASPSPRIDRQLQGRCARAGDPGRVMRLLALDEGLLAQALPAALRRMLTRMFRGMEELPQPMAWALVHALQWREQRRARAQRAALRRQDQDTRQRFGFGGRFE